MWLVWAGARPCKTEGAAAFLEPRRSHGVDRSARGGLSGIHWRAISVVAGAGVASLAVVAALVFRIFSGWSRMQADSVEGIVLNGAPLVWRRVDDVVMGGRSSSVLRADRGGAVIFSGQINTSGGGFASWRGRSRSGGPILSAETTATLHNIV